MELENVNIGLETEDSNFSFIHKFNLKILITQCRRNW